MKNTRSAQARHDSSRPRRQQSASIADRGVQLPPSMPCWFPTDPSRLGLPPSIQQSLAAAIAPAYRAFVLEAPGELERTIGNSVVYLTLRQKTTRNWKTSHLLTNSKPPQAAPHRIQYSTGAEINGHERSAIGQPATC